MLRRALPVLVALAFAATMAHAQSTEVRMLVQSSPLAGFRYEASDRRCVTTIHAVAVEAFRERVVPWLARWI